MTVSVSYTLSPVSDPSNTGKSRMLLPARAATNRPHHVLGREHHGGVEIEHPVLRLYQTDGRRFGAVLGLAVDGIDQILVHEVFRH